MENLVAITGVAGYVGSALAQRLSEKSTNLHGLWHKTAVKNNDIYDRLVHGCITEEKKWFELLEHCDSLVHCASRVGNHKWKDYEKEALHIPKMLDICAKLGVTNVIYMSSIEAFGDFDDQIVADNHPTTFSNHSYSDYKKTCEDLFTDAASKHKLRGFIVRPGMIHGPGSFFWSRRLHHQALTRTFEIIGSGSGSVFPVYIEDLVDLLISCLGTDDKPFSNEVIAMNAVNDEQLTWRDWANIYKDVLALDGDIVLRICPNSAKHQRPKHYNILSRKAYFPCNIARNLLGWAPSYSLRCGTIEYAKSL